MLLILREEIVSAIILLFLIFYYIVNKVRTRRCFSSSCRALRFAM